MAIIEEKITIYPEIENLKTGEYFDSDIEVFFNLIKGNETEIEIEIKNRKTKSFITDFLNKKQCQELSYYIKNRSVFFSNVPGPFYSPTRNNTIKVDFQNDMFSIKIEPIKEKDRYKKMSIGNIEAMDYNELAKWLEKKAQKMIEI